MNKKAELKKFFKSDVETNIFFLQEYTKFENAKKAHKIADPDFGNWVKGSSIYYVIKAGLVAAGYVNTESDRNWLTAIDVLANVANEKLNDGVLVVEKSVKKVSYTPNIENFVTSYTDQNCIGLSGVWLGYGYNKKMYLGIDESDDLNDKKAYYLINDNSVFYMLRCYIDDNIKGYDDQTDYIGNMVELSNDIYNKFIK